MFPLATAACAFLCAHILSPQARADSLATIYELALKNDAELKAAEATIKLADARVLNAAARFFPRAVAQYDATRIRQRISESENTIFNLGTARYTTIDKLVSVTQPLVDFERLLFKRREHVARDRVLAEFFAARQALIIKVVRRYLQSIAARKRIDLLRAAERSAREELKKSRIAERDGLVKRSELKSIEATSFLVRAELAEARAAYQNSLEAITELTAHKPDGVIGGRRPVPVVVPPRRMDEWVSRALESNATLRVQNFRVIETERERDRLAAKLLPKVEAVGTYDYQNRGGSEFGGGSIGDDTSVGLRIRVPLLNSDGEGYEVFQSVAQKEIERHKLDRDRRKVIREVRERYRLVVAANSKVIALRKAIEARKAAEDDARRLQANGLSTALEVLKALRERLRAERDMFEAELTYLLDLFTLISLADGVTEEHIAKLDAILGGRSHADRKAWQAAIVTGWEAIVIPAQ